MTSCNYFNPTSLHTRDCKFTTQGVWNSCIGQCIDFWSYHYILNTDAMKLLAFPMQGTQHCCYPAKQVGNPALQMNLEP